MGLLLIDGGEIYSTKVEYYYLLFTCLPVMQIYVERRFLNMYNQKGTILLYCFYFKVKRLIVLLCPCKAALMVFVCVFLLADGPGAESGD